MARRLESYVEQVIEGKRVGFGARLARALCCGLSAVFYLVVFLRNFAYRHRLLPIHRIKGPVVSIGNIVAGGTGKTPFTLMLGRALQSTCRMAILTRGYRSQAEKSSVPLVMSVGAGPILSPAEGGDEAYLLSKNLPDAIVICGKDRLLSGRLAQRMGARLLLLEDGLQHRRLGRDVEIVLLEGSDPFGMGHLLPWGYLREPIEALKRADWIVINNVHKLSETDRARLEELHPSAAVIGLRVKPHALCDRRGRTAGRRLDHKRVAAFCGLARPERFFQTIESLGASIVLKRQLPDHCGWEEEEFQQFVFDSQAQKADLIVCSEKDMVKIPSDWPCALPLIWVQLAFDFIEGEQEWIRLVAHIQQLIHELR